MSQKQSHKQIYEELVFGLPSRSSRKKKEGLDVNQEITRALIESEDTVALTSMEQFVKQKENTTFPPRSTVHNENQTDAIASENKNIVLLKDLEPITHFDKEAFSEENETFKEDTARAILLKNEHEYTIGEKNISEGIQESKEKEIDAYTNISPEEILEELCKKNFHESESKDDNLIIYDHSEEKGLSAENSLNDVEDTSQLEDNVVENEFVFTPRGSKSGNKVTDKNHTEKKSTSITFSLFIIFGVIIVIVLLCGIYYLTQTNMTEQIEYVQMSDVETQYDLLRTI